MVARYLITTADERTWKFDRPVLFLGEWCCLYERKHVWKNMDAIVAEPYGLGQLQKKADYADARALEERLFPVLCDGLNYYHGAQHDVRFWKIVLGHWFRRYLDVIFNRVKTIEKCLLTHQLSGTTIYSDVHYLLATQDSLAAIWAFNDDRWNNALYSRLMNLLDVTNCPIEVLSSDESDGFDRPQSAPVATLKRSILKLGYQALTRLGGLLARENDTFIINSYLPIKEEIKLHLALGQVPQWWVSSKSELKKKPDRALRQSLSDLIEGKSNNTLFRVICSLSFELMPVCYLEGFETLSKKVYQLPWPKKPKIIFTSNNFDFDEIFKVWAALKVESGVKYIVGQHGANYGTHLYEQHNTIEEITSDKFLSWGWEDGLPKHTPAFIFKTSGRNAGSYDPNGGLLLIERPLGHRITIWDYTHEFATYFQDQQTFIEKLQKSIRNNITVRLHHESAISRWGDIARWSEFDQDLKIDTGKLAIRKLISQNRLIVHSYDSTGILETLSQNIPTLVFWQNGFDHLKDSATPYYQLLVDAGIVHFTPESAASKVNEVWDCVESWWMQVAIQEARKIFCDRYARVSPNPISELKKILSTDYS